MLNFPNRPSVRTFFPYPKYGPMAPITSLEQLLVAEACVVHVGTDPQILFDCPDDIQLAYTSLCIERARDPSRATTLADVSSYQEHLSGQ